MYHNLSVDGYLGGLNFLAIINNAAMHIRVLVFVWTYVVISLGYIPRIAGSYGNSMVYILMNCQTFLQSGYATLHFQLQ